MRHVQEGKALAWCKSQAESRSLNRKFCYVNRHRNVSGKKFCNRLKPVIETFLLDRLQFLTGYQARDIIDTSLYQLIHVGDVEELAECHTTCKDYFSDFLRVET